MSGGPCLHCGKAHYPMPCDNNGGGSVTLDSNDRNFAMPILVEPEADNDNDNDLLATRDAMVWASRFVKRVREQPSIATDEGAMLAWFSGAMVTSYEDARVLLIELRDWFFNETRAGDQDLILWVDRINEAMGDPS